MEVATADASMALSVDDAVRCSPSHARPHSPAAGEAENIAVCIRVRPLNEREQRAKDALALRAVHHMKIVSLLDGDGQPLAGKANVFQYDHVFDALASTRDMYASAAQRIVASALDGINGTIFAYGQTSSGKTYTMTGVPDAACPEDPPASGSGSGQDVGILQLAVEDIFSFIERSTDRDFLLRVSFVEIYNEVVKDLLTDEPTGANLKMREDPRKGVYVECKEEIITTYEDILRLLYVGSQRRSVGHTAMNATSSRSHSIFKIVIESKQKNTSRRQSEDDMTGAVLVASLSLVDLAGSESMRHTAAEGARQREAGNINKSLLTLSRVINTLASSGGNGNSNGNGAALAPFRDSKLTRLLQNSLDGNTRTLIICCVTPSDRYLDESRSTLQFAARAKNIQTSASVNEVLDDQAQLKKLKREVHTLKKQLHLTSDPEAFDALKAENAALHDERSKLKEQIAMILGSVLSSSSEGIRNKASSTALIKPRTKRTRETWHPGDFTANNVRAVALDTKIAAFASPNPQPRKRQIPDESKENVDPQNLMAALNDADSSDDEDDDGEVDDTDEIMGFGPRALRRRHQAQQQREAAASQGQTRKLVELLETAILRKKGERDSAEESDDLETRIARLIADTEELVAAVQQNEELVGQQELHKMAIEEMQTRVQLAQDREQVELRQVKDALVTTEQQLKDERSKSDTLSMEKQEWLAERVQMESSLAEALAKLEALSLQSTTDASSREQELQSALRELSAHNQSVEKELENARGEMSTAKQEIGELTSQLQDAFTEHEEFKLEKEEEIAKVEEELLAKSEELENALSGFAAREAQLVQEIASLQSMQSAVDVTADVDALKKHSEELAMENERLTSERSHLMDAMVELEEQLGQITRQHTGLADEKTTLETQLNELLAERNANANERIKALEEELARAQEDIDEASNDQEAEANRADEAERELERTKLAMEESLQRHNRELERMASIAAQRESELQAAVAEKELKLKQSIAQEDEARAYKDFLQLEMDDLSTKTSNMEAAKTHFANENAQLRQQLAELNDELMDVPNALASEIGKLTECIDTLQAEVDAKNSVEKSMAVEMKNMLHAENELRAKLEEKTDEVKRLHERLLALDEDKSVWLQKSASSEELQAEMVRMREERWELATKWEESEQALNTERRELQRVVAELAELQTSYETLEKSKQELAYEITEKNTKLRQLVSELDATQTEKTALEDLVTEVEEKFEILEIAKKSLDESLAVRVAEVASKANENAALRTLLADAEDELKELRGHGAAGGDVEELEGRIKSLESTCAALESEKNALAQEVEDVARGKTALVEELSALEAQLMSLSEEKIDLQAAMDTATNEAEANPATIEALQLKVEAAEEELARVQATKEELQNSLEALKATSLESESVRGAAVSEDVEELKLQLETESQRREKAELDASSYSETVEILRVQLKNTSDALKSLELAVPESTVVKERLEHEVAKLRDELARAKEEQAELRFQNQQRLVSTGDKEAVLASSVEKLEQELAEAKDALTKTENEWKTRAQQAEQHFRRLELELEETKQKDAVSKLSVERLEQQLIETKTTLVDTETEWKKRAQQAEEHFRRLEGDLRSANDECRRLAVLVEESSSLSEELEQLKQVHSSLVAEKQQLSEDLDAREKFWQERVEEVGGKAEFETTQLQERLREAQEELDTYQRWASGEMEKLRSSVEQTDAEMTEISRVAEERESVLSSKIRHRESQLQELEATVDELQNQLGERADASNAAVEDLTSKVKLLSQELESVRLERDAQLQELTTLKTAMEKLEGDDYQHRNELEELAESLKSSQMEAMHYHAQLTEVQASKAAMNTLVDTQKKRIEKLEKVKMTTETLEMFRKLKTDRQDLQAQVKKLETELKDLAASKTQSKEAAEQQHARLLGLKEEEVAMLKSHVEELTVHMDELKRAVQNEKAKRSELQSTVEDMREKGEQELDDMRAVLQEKSEQVEELQAHIAALQKDSEAMSEHKSTKECFLEKENLELLVENRQLKKRLEGRGGASHSSAATASYRMDEDVAAFEASAKAASALLAEPSQYDVGMTVEKKSEAMSESESNATTPTTPRARDGGGLSSFLLSSSATTKDVEEEEEEEARPACAQQ